MAKRVKKKDHEKLDDATISRVISFLEQDIPITKKEACEILNISYNTKRLNNIIDNYNDKIAFEKKRRKQLRGKPLDLQDLKYIIVNYLKGDSVSSIAKALYRSENIVKKALISRKVPLHNDATDYFRPSIIPDDNIKEEFANGELVWAARYNAIAEIKYLAQEHPVHGKVYSIWIYGKHNQNGAQPWYELGALPILLELNITKEDLKISDDLVLSYKHG
jgi:transposase